MLFLRGTVTQGGADAFAQAEIVTALSGQTRRAYRVRELLFELPLFGTIASAANVELCCTRRSKAAMPNITDVDVLWKMKFGASVLTSGAFLWPSTQRFAFGEDDEIIIVEDPIYFQIDSNATTLTQTAYVRIGYEEVTLSEADRLAILVQSLE